MISTLHNFCHVDGFTYGEISLGVLGSSVGRGCGE